MIVNLDLPAGSACEYEVYAGSRHLAYGWGSYFPYSHRDWLGTERVRFCAANCGGLNQDTCTSLPFGDTLSCTHEPMGDGYFSAIHFTGKQRDFESGLDNFGARFNSSSFGRFTSPDPENAGADLEAPQSWNAYSYVLNNPLNAIDPDGLDCVYLNDAGNGVEAIDRGLSKEECTDSEHGGVYFDGTINSYSVRTDPNSDWVSAEGVVGDIGSNQQFSCGGSSCGQDTLDSFVNSIAGGPSSVTVSDSSGALSPDAAAILGQVWFRML